MSEFAPFEIAKKLKEKGFREECVAYYTKDSDFYYNTSYGSSDVENVFKSFNSRPNHICGKRIDAPTISQVLKWLIEEKRIYLGITYVPEIEKCSDFYFPTIQYIGKFKPTMYTKATDNFDNYEEAALAGIEWVLDNLI